MTWSNLVYCFNLALNVRLNGGTINKRVGLTTVEFTLSQILFGMGYTKKDVFASYKFLKAKDQVYLARQIIFDSEEKNFMKMCLAHRESLIEDSIQAIEKLKLKIQKHNLDLDYSSINSKLEKLSTDELFEYINDDERLGKEISMFQDISRFLSIKGKNSNIMFLYEYCVCINYIILLK